MGMWEAIVICTISICLTISSMTKAKYKSKENEIICLHCFNHSEEYPSAKIKSGPLLDEGDDY